MTYRYYNSNAVSDHYKAQGDSIGIAYAKAFGACWAYLTQEQKHQIFTALKIEIPELENV